jgi:hypothetical protein
MKHAGTHRFSQNASLARIRVSVAPDRLGAIMFMSDVDMICSPGCSGSEVSYAYSLFLFGPIVELYQVGPSRRSSSCETEGQILGIIAGCLD